MVVTKVTEDGERCWSNPSMMTNTETHEVLTTLREVRLELEALKRMFFEHRPPFVQAFAQHRTAVEESGFLQELDETLAAIENRAHGAD